MKPLFRIFALFVATIVFFSLCIVIGKLDIKKQQSEQKVDVLREVSTVGKSIEGIVSSTFNVANGIINLVKYQGGIDSAQFYSICQLLINENKYLMSIAIAPNNVVNMVCPYNESRSVLGLDYSTNAEQWPSVETVMNTKRSFLSSPVNLVEGGMGFINRSPIFLKNQQTKQESYWGVVSCVAHVDYIIDDAGLRSNQNLNFAIFANNEVFFGDSSILSQNPIEIPLNVINAQWKLYAYPVNGWKNSNVFHSAYFWFGCVISILLLALFISAQRNRRKLINNNELLAHEISERKDIEVELIEARKNAESENNLKTIFLADMSHEIRSPMNSILGFTDLIMSRGLGMESAMEYVEIINSSARRLLTIINDAIDVSMIDSGKMKLYIEPISLNKTLANVFKLNQIYATRNVDELIVVNGLNSGSDIVNTDGNRLTQVLNNLVTNAIKFTKNGKVKLGYTLDNNTIKFFVEDTGVGIPKEMGNSLFERFIQVDGKISTTIGGSGLGLSICRTIVNKMQGDIWYESEVGVGSKFYFSIPYVVSSNAISSIKDNKIMELDLSGKTILITDDEINNRTLFTAIFKSSKANLLVAKTGQQAIDFVKSGQHIDVILMDIKMLGLDGYETTHQIRQINSTVPIIAQTAYIMGESRQKSYDAGCNYYITKPIDIQELFSLICRILKI